MPERRTLEVCTVSKKCAKDLICIRVLDPNGAECNTDKELECLCFNESLDFKSCAESRCPHGEGCATDSIQKEPVCVSCVHILDPEIPWKGSGNASEQCLKTPKPLPSPTFSPGLAWDFCSPDMPCETATLKCLITHGRFPCTQNDVSCQCWPKELTDCENPEDCSDGETCALYVKDNVWRCVSCAHLKLSNEWTEEPSNRCQGVKDRKIPNYPPWTNGMRFDFCQANVQCSDMLNCKTKDFRPCKRNQEESCVCLPPTSANIKTCKNSLECSVGEACFRAERLPAAPKMKVCASVTTMKRLTGKVKTFGEPLSSIPDPGFGLSRDDCKFDWDCVAPRRCRHRESVSDGCAGRQGCYCEAIFQTICSSDADCVQGERCANFVGAKQLAICMSTQYISRNPIVVPLALWNESRGVNIYDSGQQLTHESCQNDIDCKAPSKGSRVCRHITENIAQCDGRDGCFCRINGDESCNSSSACEESGERCVVVTDTVNPVGKCISRNLVYDPFGNYTPREMISTSPGTLPQDSEMNPEGSEEAVTSSESEGVDDEGDFVEPAQSPSSTVCIDSNALKHIRQSDLIFKESKWAHVLCDTDGNCATAGHIVVWQGTAMMMKSFCNFHARCRNRLMLVNSPRMQKGFRVVSRTRGFEFTALAARFEFVIEEIILSSLVHLGM